MPRGDTDEPTDSSLLRVESVTRKFGRGDGAVHAVHQVSFGIGRGEIVCVVGESGSGKSTLGRLILRLLEPTSGAVFFDGQEVTRLHGRQLRSYWHQVQAVFQDPVVSFNSFLTVRRLLSRTRPLLHGADLQQRMTEALVAVGLRPEIALDRYAHQLSGGERQRVMLARALMIRPALLVADELTSMLDASRRAQILNIIMDQRQERDLAVLFITHDIGQACYVGDRVMVMKRGAVVEAGTVDQVLFHPQEQYTQRLLADVPRLRGPAGR